MTMGDRIAKRLCEMGISQRNLAMTVGVTELTMSRYIKGERIPNALILANICRAMNVKADYLLGIEDEDQASQMSPATATMVE